MEKIGVTHIGTVTAQGTEEERREMLRVMGAGMIEHLDITYDDGDGIEAGGVAFSALSTTSEES